MAVSDIAAPGTSVHLRPEHSALAAGRSALWALILRDLLVLRKHLFEFVARTLIQPFLLCFVFLYVFPKIGQGIGGADPAAQSAFATILVPGVVGISILFQGVQSVALTMSQEFGYTREIEDRVQAPCPIWLVAMAKVLSGAVQGIISAIIVLPIASVVHAARGDGKISNACCAPGMMASAMDCTPWNMMEIPTTPGTRIVAKSDSEAVP